MSFLSRKNADLVYSVISEESIGMDYPSFRQAFLEFGQMYNNQNIPLMEMNKHFIRSVLNTYGRQSNAPSPMQAQHTQHTQHQPSLSTVPNRPQGARSKNVSFDEQLELHKQHFQQFATPPPPTPPVFKDADLLPADNLELLMKQAMMERNYDATPTSPPPRKIQIGPVIEDEKHKEDMIDIEKLNAQNQIQNPTPTPTISTQPATNPTDSLPSFDFFSKLKKVTQPPPEIVAEPVEFVVDSFSIIKEKENLNENKEISRRDFEELTKKVEVLSKELEETKEMVATLSATFSRYLNETELKETPTLQIK